MSNPCPNGCACAAATAPTTQPAPPHFAFTGANKKHSAFAFILVKDNCNNESRVIAYLEDYAPDQLATTAFLQYRELLQDYPTFHGELKDIKFGNIKNQKKFPCEQAASAPKNVFKLRFVIPDKSDTKSPNTLVGLAEVSDGNEKPLPGHLGLRVYRANLNLTINNPKDWQLNSATLLYLATLGALPNY